MYKYVVVSLICIFCFFLYLGSDAPHGNHASTSSENFDAIILDNNIKQVVARKFSKCNVGDIRSEALLVSKQRQSEIEYVGAESNQSLYDNFLFSINWVPKIGEHKYSSQQERIKDANEFIDKTGLRPSLVDYLNGKKDNGFFDALSNVNANLNEESLGVWSLILRFKRIDISELMRLQSVLYYPDATVIIHAYLDEVDRNVLNTILNNFEKRDFSQNHNLELFSFAIRQESSEFLTILLDHNFPQSLGLYSLLDLQDYSSTSPNAKVIAMAEFLHSHGVKFNISPYLTDAWIWLPSSILKHYSYPDYYSSNILDINSQGNFSQKIAIVERQFKLLEQMQKCNLSRDDIFSDSFTKESYYHVVDLKEIHELESEKLISVAEKDRWSGSIDYDAIIQSKNWDKFVDDVSREESTLLRDTLYRLMISKNAPVEFTLKAIKNEGHVSNDIIVQLALSGDFATLDKIKDMSFVSYFDFDKFQLLYGGKIDEKKLTYMKLYFSDLDTSEK